MTSPANTDPTPTPPPLQASLLEWGLRAGPKTVVTLFSYGGVHPQTNLCLVNDCAKAAYLAGRAERANETLRAVAMPEFATAWHLQYALAPQDALVSRSRAVVVQRFLQSSDAEVLIMLDHDLAWVGPSQEYEGDLLHIARQCADTQAIVGGAVSKKVKGQGVASMFKADCTVQIGCDPGLVDVWYLGGAFTAYHRRALERVAKEGYLYGKHVSEQRMIEAAPGFRPVFMEMVVPHPLAPEMMLHLSEDWALCHRARELGVESHISLKPLIVHYGEYGFQVVRDSQVEGPQPQDANTPEADQHFSALPKASPAAAQVHISTVNFNHHESARAAEGLRKQPAVVPPLKRIACLHATRGRPDKARETMRQWLKLAEHPELVEYVVSIDSDDASMEAWSENCAVVVGNNRGCVDAYNRAYEKSTAPVVIQVHDDLLPPMHWDSAILGKTWRSLEDPPQAFHVDDGSQCNGDRKEWLMSIACGTRAFFDKLGGVFYPEYVSIRCDDDLTCFARQHGYYVDARHIKFSHLWGGANGDETYKRSYRHDNWVQGGAVLEKRKAAGFPPAR